MRYSYLFLTCSFRLCLKTKKVGRETFLPESVRKNRIKSFQGRIVTFPLEVWTWGIFQNTRTLPAIHLLSYSPSSFFFFLFTSNLIPEFFFFSFPAVPSQTNTPNTFVFVNFIISFFLFFGSKKFILFLFRLPFSFLKDKIMRSFKRRKMFEVFWYFGVVYLQELPSP